jgi:hypothetical protein
MLVKTMSTIGGASPRAIPMIVPKGVANEKIRISLRRVLKSLNVLYRAILTDIASANLWIMIATRRSITYALSLFRPRAIPSNIEWHERAIIRMKGVGLHFAFLGATSSTWLCPSWPSTLTLALSTNSWL